MKKIFILFVASSFLLLTSCNSDDDNGPAAKEFTVTIENIGSPKSNFNSGSTGLIMPGQSESFTFNAGKGQALQFATMYVQSNDIFIGPADTGIPLYDASGNALSGDITGSVSLWDAGTEVNEEPGVGANQAPRQTAGNTGTDENGVVELLSDVNDGYTYPALNELIQVSISHDGGSEFTVTLNNVSSTSAIPSPFAPGSWVIHPEGNKSLFETGSAASEGLEGLAEDGDLSALNVALATETGFFTPYAPGAYSVGATNDVFTAGSAATSDLESLAEDGDPSGFTNIFNTPVGASAPGPIGAGGQYSFSFSANDGDNLAFATMLIQSNDWFIGGRDINLYANGVAISGDITDQVRLYDGGTEADQHAGAGNDQAPRQAGPNTGPTEIGIVQSVASPGDHVPAVNQLVRVTITSN